MHQSSIEKTAFSPGPGYGLWEFVVMPYGLTGATQTCQQGLDKIFRKCHDCVHNYVDDIIVFSDDINSHKADLQQVLGRLKTAGFTLRVPPGGGLYHTLGLHYSAQGVTPSTDKIITIAE